MSAGLWLAAEGLSLKLGALFQNTQGFGTSQVDTNILLQPTLGGLRQSGLPQTGRYNAQMQLYTATLKAKFNGFTFASVSGYGVNKWSNLVDFSLFAASYTPYFPGSSSAALPQTSATDKFSQEFRLSGAIGSWVDWLAGAFYTHEHGVLYQNIDAADAATGALAGAAIADTDGPLSLREYAVFGDLTVHVTDRFDVQVGGRGSWNHQRYSTTLAGRAQPASTTPLLHANGTAFTYLIIPEFKITPDVMVYTRIATGYRVCGPNFSFGLAQVPESYKTDTTTNYDLGIKASVLDHRLSIDASAYYIDWKDIQLQVNGAACKCYFSINGGKAKSEGFELALEAHPAQGTTLRATGAFNNAVLTQDLPPEAVAAGAFGLDGDRLPFSARTSGSIGIDQEVIRFGSTTGVVGADMTYSSSRENTFAPSAKSLRQEFPNYTTVNLHAGSL